MSKRDVFEKNIKAATRCRSLERALLNWTVEKTISIPVSRPKISCELCGTPFRNGALIRKQIPGQKKPLTISVGGTCFVTILKRAFVDSKATPSRKKEITSRLKQTYGNLVDPGTWINWVYEHAPRRLAAIAATLRHLATIRSDDDLRKLITFHDKTRRYPKEALVPELWRKYASQVLPETITIDDARRFVRDCMKSVPIGLFEACFGEYHKARIAGDIGDDPSWLAAWDQLDDQGKQTALALCAVSDKMSDVPETTISAISRGLSQLTEPFLLPVLAWSRVHGVGVVENWIADGIDDVEAWIWADDRYVATNLSDWKSLKCESEQFVRSLQLTALSPSLPWLKLALPKIAVPGKDHRESNGTDIPSDRPEDLAILAQLPGMRELLDIAAFRPGSSRTFAAKIKWIKAKLATRGIDWEDWRRMVGRYTSDPDIKERVDGVVAQIAGRVGALGSRGGDSRKSGRRGRYRSRTRRGLRIR